MLTIRKAQEKDIDILIVLWSKLMDYHRNKKIIFPLSNDWQKQKRKELEWILESHLNIIYLIEVQNNIIGYIKGSIHKIPLLYDIKYEGNIDEIIILSQYRRKGYGTQLVRFFMKVLIEGKVEYININVDTQNEIGQKFWDNLGFDTISIHKRYNL